MYNNREIDKRALRTVRKRIAKSLGKSFPEKFIGKIRNPVFLIGCGRSGTSMLTILLRNHQDICSFSEANEIWDPKGYPWYCSKLKRPPIWYDTNTYFDVWRDYFDERYQRDLKAIFGCFQYISKKKVFLNKSPMNTYRIPEILKLFPDAEIIHIIRDGRAVAFSWAKKQYAAIKKHENVFRKRGYYYSFDELVKFTLKSWIVHMEEVEKQKKKLNLLDKDIMIEFTYEDFCKRPEEHIDLICNFLSLSRERFKINDLSHIKNMNYKWKENLSDDTKNDMNEILSSYHKKT